jgi:N-acetylmuramoyl-L-alanine amidase
MNAVKLIDVIKQLPKSTRVIKNLFVHCTAGWQTETNEQLFEGFKSRGWNNPGYHVTVDADGTAWVLQQPNLIANGVAGNNANSLHISYKGGIDKTMNAIDNRTSEQKATLVMVLKWWKSQYPNARILGHRDISPDTNHNGKVDSWERIKQCPCFDAILEYKNI